MKTKQNCFQKAVEVQDDKVILSMTGDKVIYNNPKEALHLVSPCNHKEADSRLRLHVLDASQKGFNKILIRTVHTVVFVFVISVYHQMSPAELWIAFGSGRSFCYIPIHQMAAALGDPS